MSLTPTARQEIRDAITKLGENAKQQISNAHPSWNMGLDDRVRESVVKKHKVEKAHQRYCELERCIEALTKEQKEIEKTLDQKLPAATDRYNTHRDWSYRLRKLIEDHTPEFMLSDPVGKQIRFVEVEIDRRIRELLTIDSREAAVPLLADIKIKTGK